MSRTDFAVGIGGENGQGIASTGDILARLFTRRWLHLNAYNANVDRLIGIVREIQRFFRACVARIRSESIYPSPHYG